MIAKKIKVISKKNNSNTTDKSLSVQSFSEYEMETDWDKNKVSSTLILEANIDQDLAENIATAVETKLLKMELDKVSTVFIRSLVDEELALRGKERKLMRQKLLSVPTFDLEEAIFSKTKENSNVACNSPDAVNMYLAETLLKQYALNRVFTNEVSQAHLNGVVHIHDLGYITRVYSFCGENNYITVRNKKDGTEYLVNFKNLIGLVDGEEIYNKELNAYEKFPKLWEVLDKEGFVGITRTVRHEEKQKLIKITTFNTKYIIVTKNHPCIVSDGGVYRILMADELKVGDVFLNIRNKNTISNNTRTILKGKSRIIAIEEVENSDDFVYDITTETSTFIANDLLVHNCGAHSLEAIKKHGLNLLALTSESAPAKHAHTLTGHLNTFLSIYQGLYAGALGLAYLNTFYAPMLVGLTDKQIEDEVQYLVFSLNQTAYSRGSQSIFIDANIDLEIPSFLKNVPAIVSGGKYCTRFYTDSEDINNDTTDFRKTMWVYHKDRKKATKDDLKKHLKEIGREKLIEKLDFSSLKSKVLTFGEFETQAQTFCKKFMEILHRGDKNGSLLSFPKLQLHVNKDSFDKKETRDLLMYACDIAGDKGITNFVFDRDAVSLSACILKNKEMLYKLNNVINFGILPINHMGWKEINNLEIIGYGGTFKKVKQVFCKTVSEEIYNITLGTGDVLQVTSDHPFLKVRRNNLFLGKTKLAKDLIVGDKLEYISPKYISEGIETITLVNYIKEPEITLTYDLGKFVGILLSKIINNYNTNTNKHVLDFKYTELDTIDFIKEFSKKIFNVDISIKENKKASNITVTYNSKVLNSLLAMFYLDNKLTNLCFSTCGEFRKGLVNGIMCSENNNKKLISQSKVLLSTIGISPVSGKEVIITDITTSYYKGDVINFEMKDKHEYSLNGIRSKNCCRLKETIVNTSVLEYPEKIRFSFPRNEMVLIKNGKKQVMSLSFEKLFEEVDSGIYLEDGFEVKYPKDFSIYDESGWVKLLRVVRHKKENKKMCAIQTKDSRLLLTTEDHPIIINSILNKPEICPKCGKITKIRKHGKTNYGKQIYLCIDCGKYFTDDFYKLGIRKQVLAKDMTSSMRLLKVSYDKLSIKTKKHDISIQDSYILGGYLGDGAFWKQGSFMLFPGFKEGFFIKKLKSILDGKNIKYKEREHIGKYTISFTDKKLAGLIRKKRCDAVSYLKQLPFDFLEWDKELILSLLSGLIDTDGCIHKDYVSIGHSSKILLSQIQLYLETIGVKSGLYATKDGLKNTYSYKGKYHKKQPSFMLEIPLSNEVQKLFKYSEKVKNSSIDKIKYKSYFTESDVKELIIYEDNNEYVYDVTTETSTFSCNGLLTHNCGVQNVSINLPQASIRGNGDIDKTIKEIKKAMDIAAKAHIQKKKFLSTLIDTENKPLYQLGIKDEFGEPYVDLEKSTYIIGLVGLNECVKGITGKDLHEDDESYSIGIKIITNMFLYIKELTKEFGLKFSLEESPAESSGTRLAKIDYMRYKEKSLVRGNLKTGDIFYTNSVHLIPNADVSVVERIEKQSKFAQLIESGSITHCFIQDQRPTKEAVFSLVKKTFDNTACAQLTISPELVFCPVCGFMDRGFDNYL